MPVPMKELISDAFLDLINRRSIDKVTVKEVVDACGISRQTFYYHFKDILEVIDWTIDRQCDRILAESLQKSTPAEAIGVYVDVMIKNRESLRRGLESSKHDYIRKALYRSLQEYLQALFGSGRTVTDVNLVSVQLALQFCAGGIAGVLLTHCQTQSFDRDTIVQELAAFLKAIGDIHSR